jgi:hypothetical protein
MEKPSADDLIRELYDVYSLLFASLRIVVRGIQAAPFREQYNFWQELLSFEEDRMLVLTQDGELHESVDKRQMQLAELISDMMYEPEPEPEQSNGPDTRTSRPD